MLCITSRECDRISRLKEMFKSSMCMCMCVCLCLYANGIVGAAKFELNVDAGEN